MINGVKLKFGRNSGSDALSFKPSGTVVVVGPHSSGKSLFIQELNSAAVDSGLIQFPKFVQSAKRVIVESVELADVRWQDVHGLREGSQDDQLNMISLFYGTAVSTNPKNMVEALKREDRHSFYQEINERLRSYGQSSCEDAAFISTPELADNGDGCITITKNWSSNCNCCGS